MQMERSILRVEPQKNRALLLWVDRPTRRLRDISTDG